MPLPQQTPYLQLLTDPQQPLIIGPTDGSRVIAKAEDVFNAGIDGDFNNWGVNQPAELTEEMQICPYEMVIGNCFAQIFGSLSSDLRQLCLTQDQIIEICQNHRDHLRRIDQGNFFLTKSNVEFFVVCVGVYGGGKLKANIYRFGNVFTWGNARSMWFFVPQLPVPQQGKG